MPVTICNMMLIVSSRGHTRQQGHHCQNRSLKKNLVGALMNTSGSKIFIVQPCSHTHLGLCMCLWNRLDLTSNHSNSIQSDLHAAWQKWEMCRQKPLGYTVLSLALGIYGVVCVHVHVHVRACMCVCVCVRVCIRSVLPLYVFFLCCVVKRALLWESTLCHTLLHYMNTHEHMKAQNVRQSSPRKA